VYEVGKPTDGSSGAVTLDSERLFPSFQAGRVIPTCVGLEIVFKLDTIVFKLDTDMSRYSMASALFPKARRAVLGLLFGLPDRAFYLREIARMTGLSVRPVQRELARLSGAGILSRTRQGRQVYFQADPGCPLYQELRGIVTKAIGAAEALRQALSAMAERVDVAFIYGSVATGREGRASDLDLMVIGEVSFGEVVSAIRHVEKVLARPVNPTVYPTQEFQSKLRKGHHFLSSVVTADKVFVLGGEDELAALQTE
jgi:predicted nucleotidyltransferase